MTPLQQDDSGLWAQQSASAFLDYGLDWPDLVDTADGIASSTWIADADLTLSMQSFSGVTSSVWIRGGVPGKWYLVTNQITSINGRQDSRYFRLLITDATDSITAPSVLFSKAMIVPLMRMAISRTGVAKGDDFDPDEIWSFVVAAEKEAARQLRVFLTPTEVFPPDPSDADIAGLPTGMPWVEDAGYDYDPEFFHGEQWGFLVTRQRPVIDVKSITFKYPSPTGTIYQIPDTWIRLDKKYGHIRLVPASQAFSAPLSAFLMQAMGGGQTIPFMIHVRYTAGLQNISTDWPDLVDVIKKMAVMRALVSSFPAQSGSISADGLSQSNSLDMSKWQEVIDKMLDDLRDAIHGPRMIAL